MDDQLHGAAVCVGEEVHMGVIRRAYAIATRYDNIITLTIPPGFTGRLRPTTARQEDLRGVGAEDVREGGAARDHGDLDSDR